MTDQSVSAAAAADRVQAWLDRTSRTDPHLSDTDLRVLVEHARATSALARWAARQLEIAYRDVLVRAIREHAPNRAQVGGKTVTPEDAAEAVLAVLEQRG